MSRINKQFSGSWRAAAAGLLALSLVFILAACGDAAATPTTAPAVVDATATTAPAIDNTATTAPGAVATMEPTMDMGAAATTVPAAEPTTAPATDPTATTAAAGGSSSAATEVDATLREWGLDLSTTTVAAGSIHFVVSNTGQMMHNFTIKDASGNQIAATSNFSPGSPQTLDVTLAAGTYTVYCSLPGHAQRGQQNTLVVQ